MKLVKRAASILMAAIMAMSLSATAFAETSTVQKTLHTGANAFSVTNISSQDTYNGMYAVYFATDSATVTFDAAMQEKGIAYICDGSTIDDLDANMYDFVMGIIHATYTDSTTLTKAGIYGITASKGEAQEVAMAFLIITTEAPAGITATPTAATVLVNGVSKSFDAYNIYGSNYFKLRDLAYVLNGTEKQFEVSWDATNNAISLTSGKAYTSVGTEMEAGASANVTATSTTASVYKDGTEASLTAYNINDNNYFKLRDIGQAIDFGITWDGDISTIGIDTSTGYTA